MDSGRVQAVVRKSKGSARRSRSWLPIRRTRGRARGPHKFPAQVILTEWCVRPNETHQDALDKVVVAESRISALEKRCERYELESCSLVNARMAREAERDELRRQLRERPLA